jgi:hypothetical protein
VSSSLGKLAKIELNSLFTSFFGMVRVKVACKDVTKIHRKKAFPNEEEHVSYPVQS